MQERTMPADGQPSSHPINWVDFSAPPNHTFQVNMAREGYPSDRRVRQFKDVVLFIFCLILAGIIAWLCGRALLSTTANPEQQKWAMSIMSGMAGGIVGYLVRR
jgi:hypothetical protein